MPNINDIINSIDRAMWRIQDSRVNNVTPFTYRDGLTYLEVLERIRGAVSETISYVGEFGEEQKKIIASMNEKVTTFIAEMEKTHDGWNKDIEAKRKETLDTIEAFKDRLIAVALTPSRSSRYNLDNAFVGAQMMDGRTQYMATINLTEKMEGRIDAANKKIDDQIAALPATYYNKTYLDQEFQRVTQYDQAVIIGSSNVKTDGGKWATQLATEYGFKRAHNYGIGGGAFTSAQGARFDTQIQNAYRALGDNNQRVGGVFIIDMLNDIRAMHNVQQMAEVCAGMIETYWPSAKVYCIPVIWNDSSLNASKMSESIQARTSEFMWAFNKLSPAICEGSLSWFHGDKSVIRGNDEVHLTDDGYQQAKRYALGWLRGGTSWNDYGWRDLSPWGEDANGLKKSTMTLRIKREHTNAYIRGWFEVIAPLGADHPIWSIPGWATPYSNQYFQGMTPSREWKTFYVNTAGQLVSADPLTVGTQIYLFSQWGVW